MPTYECVNAVEHSELDERDAPVGRRYEAGEPIELTEEQAQPLLEAGHIRSSGRSGRSGEGLPSLGQKTGSSGGLTAQEQEVLTGAGAVRESVEGSTPPEGSGEPKSPGTAEARAGETRTGEPRPPGTQAADEDEAKSPGRSRAGGR